MTYTTAREVRRAFWEQHPQLDRRKIPHYSGEGTMYCTDTRCAFVDWVDYLSKDGQVTEKLANLITLE